MKTIRNIMLVAVSALVLQGCKCAPKTPPPAPAPEPPRAVRTIESDTTRVISSEPQIGQPVKAPAQ